MKQRTADELAAIDRAMGTTAGILLAAHSIASQANANQVCSYNVATDGLLDDLAEMGKVDHGPCPARQDGLRCKHRAGHGDIHTSSNGLQWQA